MMDSKLATDLGLELESLGNMTTHSFMGNTRENAYKSKARIRVDNQRYIELDCLVGRCFLELPRYNYEVPEHWTKKYNIKP